MTLNTHSKKDTKDLLVVLVDISGSMQSIRQDAEGGLTAFLNEQKDIPGGADLLLIEFDDRYIRHDLININDFKSYTLEPLGMTALLDAIGKSIHDAEKTPVSGDGKVIFNIITDGGENSSKEYTLDAVKSLIERKQAQGWEFIFSGANIDAISVARSMGISGQSAVTFKATGDGVLDAFYASTSYVGSIRGGDKAKAVKDLENAKLKSSNLS